METDYQKYFDYLEEKSELEARTFDSRKILITSPFFEFFEKVEPKLHEKRFKKLASQVFFIFLSGPTLVKERNYKTTLNRFFCCEKREAENQLSRVEFLYNNGIKKPGRPPLFPKRLSLVW